MSHPINSKTIPAELPMDADGACALSLECWRLSLIAELLRDNNEGAGLRHAVRRITETLKGMGIEVVDFAGRPYDPGMVPEVVEVREDQRLPDGHAVIEETIAPTVTWRGQVIKPGQIIVKRSPVRPQDHTKVFE
ncbi:MAG: hypothetical protein Q8S00_20905 [Deltaproteobacteria bacterium]|nr:hypothetical protein [Deltaproteobacteria bacterium]